MISGYPGETETQHKELLAFIKDFQFDNLGVFEYSPEPSTPAGRLYETLGVPAKVALARKEELMLAQQKILLKKNKKQVGQTLSVLVDAVDMKNHVAIGRHGGQAPDVDGTVLAKLPRGFKPAPGEVIQATVTDFNYYDLIAKAQGEVIAKPASNGKKNGRLSLPVIG